MAEEPPKAETKKFKGVYWGSSVAAPGEAPSDGIMRVSGNEMMPLKSRVVWL